MRRWMMVLIVLFGLWVAADWTLRFVVFRWQDSFVTHGRNVSAASSPTETSGFSWKVQDFPVQMGGSLSKMIPLVQARENYEEYHDAFSWCFGTDGYIWGTTEERANQMAGTKHFDAVLVGDSCWVSAGTQIVSEVMGDLTGKTVLNRGRPGGGPFLALRWWAEHGPADGLSTDVIVWNISSREIGAPLFGRQDVSGWFNRSADAPDREAGEKPTTTSVIQWDTLNPRRLDHSLPNTSMTAYFAKKAWACARLLIGIWPQDVVGGDDGTLGPTLYYRYNFEQLAGQSLKNDVPVVTAKIMEADSILKASGTQLVVVLVPEKEQVADSGLSADKRESLSESLEVMRALEQDLKGKGIRVVNLLDPFRNATARGERLFWRDDTHWNDAGMYLAAHLIAQELGWDEVAP